jgi:hypothetical protein
LSEENSGLLEAATASPASAESPEKVEVTIDTSKIREEMADAVRKAMEAKELEKPEGGTGQVAESVDISERHTEIIENMKKGVKEQWTVALPKTTKEAASHLRDYCNESNALEGKPGNTVNIPYVTDFDLSLLSAVGASTTAITGAINSTSATIVENHAWHRIGYHTVEEMDSNVLDQINQAFGRAAVRAEDQRILNAIHAKPATSFAAVLDHTDIGTDFQGSWFPEAIEKLMAAGKDVSPGQCICWMTPSMYGALLKELGQSTPAAFARPDVMKTGIVTNHMGVNIVVGPKAWFKDALDGEATSRYCAVFARMRRAVVFAPKRDVTIESEKDTVERDYKLTGSHTMAVSVIDPNEIVEIVTSAA